AGDDLAEKARNADLIVEVGRVDSIIHDAALDDPVGDSLRGHHGHLARRYGRALTYASPVATFVAVPVNSGPDEWAELATLLGPDGVADVFSAPVTAPSDWQPDFAVEGCQVVYHVHEM